MSRTKAFSSSEWMLPMCPLLFSHSSLQLNNNKDEDWETSDDEQWLYYMVLRKTLPIHSIVVLLDVLQNEITGVFKSVRAINWSKHQVLFSSSSKYQQNLLTSCTGSIWHCVLEVADITLKNSGCTVYAGVREHITGREQEAHVPACYLWITNITWTMTIADLSVPPIPPAHPCES